MASQTLSANPRISRCKNGHYFFDLTECHHCGGKSIADVEYREGDCVDCGALCQRSIYACNSPNPIVVKEVDKPERK